MSHRTENKLNEQRKTGPPVDTWQRVDVTAPERTSRYPAAAAMTPVQEFPLPTTGSVNACDRAEVVVVSRPDPFSLGEAYMLCLLVGFLGAHHFYLRRYGFGLLYLFTGGLCGVGWIVDWFRLPYLVTRANRRETQQQLPNEEPFCVSDAYVLWFPLGFLGFHHYYLQRPAWGVLYTFTGGMFVIGWLVDAFRLPALVREANQKACLELQNPVKLDKSLGTAYALVLPPAGLLGAHHIYLQRPFFSVFYLLTLGGAGVGWIVDLFRMKWLVHRANHPEEQLLGNRHKFLDDAYVLAFPFGFLGLHHFYLGRPGWGTLYVFTGGLLGLGWLVDLCRMPCLVSAANERLLDDMRLAADIRQYANGTPYTPTSNTGGGQSGTTIHIPFAYNETPILQPPSYDCAIRQGGYGIYTGHYNPSYIAGPMSSEPPRYDKMASSTQPDLSPSAKSSH